MAGSRRRVWSGSELDIAVIGLSSRFVTGCFAADLTARPDFRLKR
jgi:hypothetical protein